MVLIAFFLAVALFFGAGGGFFSSLTASAAENAPNEAGWYVVGAGAGSLKGCSWLEYNSAFRLTGTSYDDPNADYQDYLGFWQTEPMLLYEGNQFKFLYNDGSWTTTEESEWAANLTAGFGNIADNIGSAFASAGLGNIQVREGHSGYYTFYLYATRTAQNGVALTLTFYYDASRVVPPITSFDMYVVGEIASVPACGWADEINVAENGVKMTHSAQTDMWYSPVLYLVPTDSFKVYDYAMNVYYPSGVGDNKTVRSAGWYYIQWGAYDQTYAVISVSAPEPEPEPEPTTYEKGWYVIGNGAGYLKGCSWTEYLEEYRLTNGTDVDENNYDGIWTLNDVLLYQGDAFKILYNNGTDETPDDSGWGADIQVQYSNITENAGANFTDGGLGNIQALVSGYYNLTLDVYTENGVTTISLSYTRQDKEVPPIDLYEMYVVGKISSVPACNWPGYTDVATNCIKMTYIAETDKWIANIYLVPSDEFKVYNAVNNAYYPSGIAGNHCVETASKYVIEWGTDAPDILVIPESEYSYA